MTNETENQLVKLVATDKLYVAVSSLDGKLKRRRESLAKSLAGTIESDFAGERVYANLESENNTKARGMKEGIQEFKKAYPQYGKILEGMIEEKRAEKETNLYFGLIGSNRLSSKDYMTVMTSLGFTEHAARGLYPELIASSRNLSKKRDFEERSILVG